MTAMANGLWRRAAAQAAIFALVFQTALGVLGCGAALRPAAAKAPGASPLASGSLAVPSGETLREGAICAAGGVKGMAAPDGAPPAKGSGAPSQHDCPHCLTAHRSCSAAMAPQAFLLLAPSLSVLARAPAERQHSPREADASTSRNRGPPVPRG